MRMIRTGTKLTHPAWEQKPSISCGGTGTYKTGEVVTCAPGLIQGPAGTVTYQWIRDAADIGGQTAATHTLVAGDETHKVRCRVTKTPTDTKLGARSYLTPQSPTCIP